MADSDFTQWLTKLRLDAVAERLDVGDSDIAALVSLVLMMASKSAEEDLDAQDIEALAFLVLMEASKSAKEDLEQIMETVKATNQGIDCHSESLARIRAALAGVDLGASNGALAAELDHLDELAELQALRLQTAMDRLSKAASTLSNLSRLQSEFARVITRNTK